jgi:hypothetical protein
MTAGNARRRMSLMIAGFGVDGSLVLPKYGPGAEGGEPAPGDALKWPPCECGHTLCPDYEPAQTDRPPGGVR